MAAAALEASAGKGGVGLLAGTFAVVLLAASVGDDSIVRFLGAVTGGARWAGIVIGAALLVVPGVVALVVAWQSWRHEGPLLRPGWVLAVPVALAVALSPNYGSLVYDTSLHALENAKTPGLITGVEIGWCVLLIGAFVAGVLWIVYDVKRKIRLSQARPSSRPVRRGRARRR